MNRIKRPCALLLALVLIFGVALPPVIAGVFAEEMERTKQTVEPTTEQTEEPATEQTVEPATEQTVEPATEQTEEPAEEPIEEPIDEQPEEPIEELTEDVPAELPAELAELPGDTVEEPAPLPETDPGQVPESDPAPDEYIYFDLAADNVTIGASSYSGAVYVGGVKTTVSATTRTGSEKFYIYQSNLTDTTSPGYYMNTGYVDATAYQEKNCRVPAYPRVQSNVQNEDGTFRSWTEYITNNTAVKTVSENWADAAKNSQRTATENNITFKSESLYSADVVIDNIWSSYHKPGKEPWVNGKDNFSYRTSGGIGANLSNTGIHCTDTHIQLRLKGDNRVGCVHYSAAKGARNTIEFYDGETSGTAGSITVADFPGKFKENYWSSAIGGADSPNKSADQSDGIVINSGIIYAGTTSGDDSTAIGGGGNGFGGVTIIDGIVTAVAASTGTAIGGGIGWSNAGGDANVTIRGGAVYAYNYGIGTDSGNYTSFVPAVAIGGGSADTNKGNDNTEVTIIDGFVYAESVAGAAIGGGGSGTNKGGSATVNISGGTVIAKSIGKNVTYSKKTPSGAYIGVVTEPVLPGVSIGGGTGNTAGGSVTLTIKKEDGKAAPILRTGSIGGGRATANNVVGWAKVTIDDGDIAGQVVMASTGIDENKENDCAFTMSGGKLHGTNVIDGIDHVTSITDPNPNAPIKFIHTEGGALWMEDADGVTNISGGEIYGCTAELGGAVYMKGGKFEMTGGSIYGNTARKTSTADTGHGGGVYVIGGDVNIKGDASISHNTAGESGGGVYLSGGGSFTLEGEGASISHNTAYRGGGAYLYINPTLNQGAISENTATLNGGGLYIDGCEVTLDATKDVVISGNTADNGGGIFINKFDPNDPDLAGLRVDAGIQGSVSFTGNTATGGGGAVCVNNGYFEMHSGNVTITGNTAGNGGGVAVNQGDFIMTAGSIGQSGEGGGNTATNGGGVFVARGKVRMSGGAVQYNEATNGGGAYVAGDPEKHIGGWLIMENGSISHNTATDGGGAYVTGGTGPEGGWFVMANGSISGNTATRNGGGGYAAGDFHMISGTVSNNTAQNDGGGIYVDEGNAMMADGAVTGNSAQADGGGICIVSSSSEDPIEMVMLSGSLSSNAAGKKGGGLAVKGSDTQPITVEIGCLLDHRVTQTEPDPVYPISYLDGGKYQGYLTIGETTYEAEHGSCPVVVSNQAEETGGAIYVDSNSATLSFFCVQEHDNTTTNLDATDIEVDGGRVAIGDHIYHNYRYDADQGTAKRGNPWGYVSMADPARVNAGQVDLYGNMINPYFDKDIMVDIADTTKNHFIDHRLSENLDRHRIHYYENFKGIGLFRVFQYDESIKKVTVQSALFSQPGYTILGWSTKPDHNEPDAYDYWVGDEINFEGNVPGMGQEHANCDLCKDYTSENLLVLYAIWDAIDYTVVYDPNVPQGDTYTGTMAEQIHTYGQEKALRKNAYRYPGHFFAGWTMRPDGVGTRYGDEELVSNLTDKSEEVTLYAQWTVCDHKTMGVRTYTAEGNTLTRTCSCGGQTLTATVAAEDTVYNGLPHPAKLTYNDEVAWGSDKPTLEYTGERLTAADETAYGPLEFGANGIPFHAGLYTATIKHKGPAGVKASANYTIAKADQTSPEKPTYTIKADGTLTINRVTPDPNQFQDDGNISHTAKAEYSLAYQGATVVWKTFADGNTTSTSLDFTMDDALTNYTVQVRYEELEDYNASKITKAAEVYFFTGDVTVIIVCDEGISCEGVQADGTDATDGVTLTLTTETGYYLVNGNYDVTAELTMKDNSTPTSTPTVTSGTDGKYSVTNIQTGSTLTITVGTAKKAAQGEAQVTPGQVFSSFTGVPTTISRDSAFTAAYQIINYDPAVYAEPNLTFSSNIPQGTTVILLDRRDGSYWYYRATSAVSSVPLTDFNKMGGEGTYTIPSPEAGNNYIDLSYQFIVDFSQSAGYPEASLTMTLNAPANTGTAPVVNPAVTVSMATSGFDFAKTAANGLTNSFTCTFTKGAAASKWENRASALVLTPTEATATALPPDARIKAEVVNGGTTYLYKSGNSFIVPLSLLEAGTKTVHLTLESDLFPEDAAASYEFTVQWRISPSEAGKAPMIGDQAGTLAENVTFASQARMDPSLKSKGDQRVLSSGNLELTLEKLNLDADKYTISAALLQKLEGAYSGTGWNMNDVSGTSLSVPVAGQKAGSFCLMLTVKAKDSVTTVMEVPYYFVIKATA